MNKLIDFRGISADIQAYANEHYEGNFSMAVRQLLKQAIEQAAKVA